MVAAARLGLRLGQRPVRVALVQARSEHAHDCAASSRGWFYCNQCHGSVTLRLGRNVDGLTIGKSHISLALVAARTGARTERPGLAFDVDQVH